MAETQATMCYPHERQQSLWKDRAEEMGYNSLSKWIIDMTEAGYKKFEVNVEPDQTNKELRQQRNDLKKELDQARSRIGELENQVYSGETEAIISFVEDNPGATYADIKRHLQQSLRSRTTEAIEFLDGDVLEKQDDGYVVVEDR